jgi:hypothetical protein
VDESDLNVLISYVKNHQRMVSMVKGPLLSLLEDLKLNKADKPESPLKYESKKGKGETSVESV